MADFQINLTQKLKRTHDLTKVLDFPVELSLQLSNKILDDLTKFYENIVGLENKTDFTVLNTV
jgi:hypothetical protein